jgi:hypothetical protein
MLRQTRGPRPVVKFSCFFRVFKDHKKTCRLLPAPDTHGLAPFAGQEVLSGVCFFFGAPTGMWFNLVDLLWSNVPLACANEGSKCLYHYLHVVTNSELFCKLGCLQVLRLSNVCTYVFLEVGGSHETGTDWPRGMSFIFIHFHPISFWLKLNENNELRFNFPCRGLETIFFSFFWLFCVLFHFFECFEAMWDATNCTLSCLAAPNTLDWGDRVCQWFVVGRNQKTDFVWNCVFQKGIVFSCILQVCRNSFDE